MMLIKNLIHSRGLLSPLLVTKLEIDIIVAPSETVGPGQASLMTQQSLRGEKLK